ncbi:hypothetical protein GBA52_027979 [Prunus armeniaca]|nr:hypothetical protein GBA52_027979 [Prunus armeniaca]
MAMDSILNSSLEEICSEGINGLPLKSLCSRLQPSLSSFNLDVSDRGLKQALWAGLRSVPTLKFQSQNQKVQYSPTDPLIQSVQEAEKLNLKLVADQRLMNNFLGLYIAHSSIDNMCQYQRQTLERVAGARTDGITQSQLSKDLGIQGENYHYKVRNLECQGLIVKRPALERKKNAGDEGQSSNNLSVTTNVIYLYRYAENLSSQQKIENTKVEQTKESFGNAKEIPAGGDGFSGKGVKEDVLVKKDYLISAMKAVCDKLEQANGKVLVADIKKDLGYSGTRPGNRAWRKICGKLEAAHIVKKFEVQVNKKVEQFLGLLKKFCPMSFDPKNPRQVKFIKKCQTTDLLVELPIEHQIQELINAAGSEGIIMSNVSKRLGIGRKESDKLIESMCSRFGMIKKKERNKKIQEYRDERDGVQSQKSKHASLKRKRTSEARSVEFTEVDEVTRRLKEPRLATLPVTGKQLMEERNLLVTSGEHDSHLHAFQRDGDQEIEQEPEPNEDGEGAFSKLKPTRQSRFSWTEEADRQLVIQYARCCATLGAKYHHQLSWASLPDLPAPPSTCKRRMSYLKNSNGKFRKSLMMLCNMLSKRYAKLLEKTKNRSLNKDECRQLLQGSTGEDYNMNFPNISGHNQGRSLQEEPWDDFDDNDIKKSLEEMLHYQRMPRLDATKRYGSTCEEGSDLNTNAEEDDSKESELIVSTVPYEDIQNHSRGVSAQRPSCQQLHNNFFKLLHEGVVSTPAYKSLAVELFKLVFLSTTTAPEEQNLVAEIKRRYSKCDLYAALNYLRDNKILIGGTDSQPLSLSPQFFPNIFKSPFPIDSGKRAAKLSRWLHGRDKDLMEGGIDLSADLECGDLFHLFALVSSGQLSISPCLPDEGVGEAEDLRSSKRKIESNECLNTKKLKSLVSESEMISRREKGFPGIMVSVCRAESSASNCVDFFKDDDTSSGEKHFGGNDRLDSTSVIPHAGDCDSGGAHSQGETNMNVNDVHKVTILSSPEEVAERSYEKQTCSVPEGCMEVVSARGHGDNESSKFTCGKLCVPILPWINGDGTINKIIYKGLRRRLLGIVMQNPGILEDEIMGKMDVLNAQTCRKLLELVVLDKHVLVRKMRQNVYSGLPAILRTLPESSFPPQKLVFREHFFANSMSSSLL